MSIKQQNGLISAYPDGLDYNKTNPESSLPVMAHPTSLDTNEFIRNNSVVLDDKVISNFGISNLDNKVIAMEVTKTMSFILYDSGHLFYGKGDLLKLTKEELHSEYFDLNYFDGFGTLVSEGDDFVIWFYEKSTREITFFTFLNKNTWDQENYTLPENTGFDLENPSKIIKLNETIYFLHINTNRSYITKLHQAIFTEVETKFSPKDMGYDHQMNELLYTDENDRVICISNNSFWDIVNPNSTPKEFANINSHSILSSIILTEGADEVIYVVSKDYGFRKSTDGGYTWSEKIVDVQFKGMAIIDDTNDIYLFGDNGIFYKKAFQGACTDVSSTIFAIDVSSYNFVALEKVEGAAYLTHSLKDNTIFSLNDGETQFILRNYTNDKISFDQIPAYNPTDKKLYAIGGNNLYVCDLSSLKIVSESTLILTNEGINTTDSMINKVEVDKHNRVYTLGGVINGYDNQLLVRDVVNNKTYFSDMKEEIIFVDIYENYLWLQIKGEDFVRRYTINSNTIPYIENKEYVKYDESIIGIDNYELNEIKYVGSRFYLSTTRGLIFRRVSGEKIIFNNSNIENELIYRFNFSKNFFITKGLNNPFNYYNDFKVHFGESYVSQESYKTNNVIQRTETDIDAILGSEIIKFRRVGRNFKIIQRKDIDAYNDFHFRSVSFGKTFDDSLIIYGPWKAPIGNKEDYHIVILDNDYNYLDSINVEYEHPLFHIPQDRYNKSMEVINVNRLDTNVYIMAFRSRIFSVDNIVNSLNLVITQDNGVTWKRIEVPKHDKFNNFLYNSDNLTYAGDFGFILSNNNVIFSSQVYHEKYYSTRIGIGLFRYDLTEEKTYIIESDCYNINDKPKMTFESIRTMTSNVGVSPALFGRGIAVDEAYSVLVVGMYFYASQSVSASGAVEIYKPVYNNWEFVERIEPPTPIANGYFGTGISISGDGQVMVIGESNNDTGKVYTYDKVNGSWVRRAQIVVADDVITGDNFGHVVDLDYHGHKMIIGANNHNSNGGAVYIFEVNPADGVWSQVHKISNPTANSGAKFGQGCTISHDGKRIAVIGQYLDDTVDRTKFVFVYDKTSDVSQTWEEITEQVTKLNDGLIDTDLVSGDVTIEGNGDILCISAACSDEMITNGGKLYFYYLSGTDWILFHTSMLADANAESRFGSAMAFAANGQKLILGEPNNNDIGASGGRMHIYELVYNKATTKLDDYAKSIGLCDRLVDDKIYVQIAVHTGNKFELITKYYDKTTFDLLETFTSFSIEDDSLVEGIIGNIDYVNYQISEGVTLTTLANSKITQDFIDGDIQPLIALISRDGGISYQPFFDHSVYNQLKASDQLDSYFNLILPASNRNTSIVRTIDTSNGNYQVKLTSPLRMEITINDKINEIILNRPFGEKIKVHENYIFSETTVDDVFSIIKISDDIHQITFVPDSKDDKLKSIQEYDDESIIVTTERNGKIFIYLINLDGDIIETKHLDPINLDYITEGSIHITSKYIFVGRNVYRFDSNGLLNNPVHVLESDIRFITDSWLMTKSDRLYPDFNFEVEGIRINLSEKCLIGGRGENLFYFDITDAANITVNKFNVFTGVISVHTQITKANYDAKVNSEIYYDNTTWFNIISIVGIYTNDIIVVEFINYNRLFIIKDNAKYEVMEFHLNMVNLLKDNSNLISTLESPEPGISNGRFGTNMALSSDGKVLAVSAPGIGTYGTVYIYDKVNGSWIYRNSITDSNSPVSGEKFGETISLNSDGTILVVGVPEWDNGGTTSCGKIAWFQWGNDEWTQKVDVLKPAPAMNEYFGYGVSISADGTKLVGIVPDVSIETFDFVTDNWVHNQSNVPGFAPLTGIAFGYSTWMNDDGTILYVSNSSWDTPVANAGRMIRYNWNVSNGWEFDSGFELNSTSGTDERFGTSFHYDTYEESVSDRAIVGAFSNSISGGLQGAAYVYQIVASVWTRIQTIYPPQVESNIQYFGSSVLFDVSSSNYLVGSSMKDVDGEVGAGKIYIFDYNAIGIKRLLKDNMKISIADNDTIVFHDKDFGNVYYKSTDWLTMANDDISNNVSAIANSNVDAIDDRDILIFGANDYKHKNFKGETELIDNNDYSGHFSKYTNGLVHAFFDENVNVVETIDRFIKMRNPTGLNYDASTSSGGNMYREEDDWVRVQFYKKEDRLENLLGSQWLISEENLIKNNDIKIFMEFNTVDGDAIPGDLSNPILVFMSNSGQRHQIVMTQIAGTNILEGKINVAGCLKTYNLPGTIYWANYIGNFKVKVWSFVDSSDTTGVLYPQVKKTSSLFSDKKMEYNELFDKFDGDVSFDFTMKLPDYKKYKDKTEIVELIESFESPDLAGSEQFGEHICVSHNGQVMAIADDFYNTDGKVDSGIIYIYRLENNAWIYRETVYPTDLAASDNFGSLALNEDGTLLIVASPMDDDTLSGSGSLYAFKYENGSWVQKIKQASPKVEASQNFGRSLALNEDGTKLIVGANGDDTGGSNSGIAYIFDVVNTSSNVTIALHSSVVGLSGSQFGYGVSISGDGSTILCGALLGDRYGENKGIAYLYDWIDGTWKERYHFNADLYDLNTVFGTRCYLSRDGKYAAISSYSAKQTNNITNVGKVWFFELKEREVVQLDTINVPKISASGYYGDGLYITPDCDEIYVGYAHQSVPGASGGWGGKVYRYKLNLNRNYEPISKIEYVDKLIEADLKTGAYFGNAVAMSGDGKVYAVGAKNDNDGTLTNSGKVYIYDKNENDELVKRSVIEASDKATNDFFGQSVSLNYDGSLLVVGAHVNDTALGADMGRVYVFEWNDPNWVERNIIDPDDSVSSDPMYFGNDVCINGLGTRIFVTAPWANTAAGNDAGKVYIYNWVDPNWVEDSFSPFEPSNPLAGDRFGRGDICTNHEGDFLIVGSETFNTLKGGDSGVVHTYRLSEGEWIEQNIFNDKETTISNFYGGGVGLSGDGKVLCIGSITSDVIAGADDNLGRVYVYVNNNGYWTKTDVIKIPENPYPVTNFYFGVGIGVNYDGSEIFIGAIDDSIGVDNGACYRYKAKHGIVPKTTYKVNHKLTLQPNIIRDSAYFGSGVAYSGDGNIMAISSSQLTEIHIYQKTDHGWKFKCQILDNDPIAGSGLGESIDLNYDGSKIVIGAHGITISTYTNAGKVYTYELVDGYYKEINTARLQSSLLATSGYFGFRCSITDDGKSLAVTSYGYESWKGRVFFYRWNDGTSSWDEELKFAPFDAVTNSKLRACDLSGDGTTLVLGCPNHDGGKGKVYIYEYMDANWVYTGAVYQENNPHNAGYQFGQDVAISDDKQYLLVGEYTNDDIYNNNGKAHLFRKFGDNSWKLVKSFHCPIVQEAQQFGYGVAFHPNGKEFAVTANQYNHDGGTLNGGIFLFDLEVEEGTDKTHRPLIDIEDNISIEFDETYDRRLKITSQDDSLEIPMKDLTTWSYTNENYLSIRTLKNTQEVVVRVNGTNFGPYKLMYKGITKDSTIKNIQVGYKNGNSLNGIIYEALIRGWGDNRTVTELVTGHESSGNPYDYEKKGSLLKMVEYNGQIHGLFTIDAEIKDAQITEADRLYLVPFDTNSNEFTDTGMIQLTLSDYYFNNINDIELVDNKYGTFLRTPITDKVTGFRKTLTKLTSK